MKLTIDLSIRETNLILNALHAEYEKIRKSKSVSWTPSSKAMTMSDISTVRNKIVGAEYEAKQQGEEVGATSQVVGSNLDEPGHDE